VNPMIESLAAIEHERWADWQRWMHQQCQRNPDGSLTIPAALVERWEWQSATPYAELSESEKQSDRDQVERYLPVIKYHQPYFTTGDVAHELWRAPQTIQKLAAKHDIGTSIGPTRLFSRADVDRLRPMCKRTRRIERVLERRAEVFPGVRT
jgi:hypothetical protein